MLRLVRSSIPRLPADACLLDMTREAERHHVKEGCCSLLYFHDFRFVQVVEGPATPVARYAARLRMDDSLPPQRHFGYAITWWGLAIALLAVYLAFHHQKGRLRFRGGSGE